MRTARGWPLLDYDSWADTRDTLHAHTQVLGKLAVSLAPPQPQLQHAALRLTARGWETLPLPTPDGSGAIVVSLNLTAHETLVEHSNGTRIRIRLTPDRPVGEVTQEVLEAVQRLGGPFAVNLVPQEVEWSTPLDRDTEHARYDAEAVERYFAAATQGALILGQFRAAFRGRSTPVNAWWGSFDLAVSLFSGAEAAPPSDDFIMRNAMDSQEVAVGWWPGDGRYPRMALYGYAHPATEGFPGAQLSPPAAHWEGSLGEYILDWDELADEANPRALGVRFAESVFTHACMVCGWDGALAATATGNPPPLR